MKIKTLSLLFSSLFIVACAEQTPEPEYTTSDTLNPEYTDSYQPQTNDEIIEYVNKWTASNVETKWQDYKGTLVRAQIINGNKDLREMRLRVYKNSEGADIDGDSSFVLTKVSDYLMKQTCGRNAQSVVTIYERPAFEYTRPTPFFNYLLTEQGPTMKEVGFRCVY